jgi:hypothetical protein
MSKFADPIYVQLDPKDVARWTANRRRRDKVGELPDGFTFKPSGRDGYIYYREGERMLELLWEMSGPDDYDILLALDGLREWVLPQVEPIEITKQQEIEASLRSWLRHHGIRALIEEVGP